MAALAPLAMSQTKDDLLKHLNLAQDVYNMMAKETDHVYQWLTSDKRHLKHNCKRKPPYDWSDIVEKSKDEAISRIAQSDNPRTSYYWKLAVQQDGCENWIAKWFLYHKFRYRDGRNRNPNKGEDGKHKYCSGSKHSHHKHAEVDKESDVHDYTQDSYHSTSTTFGSPAQGYAYTAIGSSSTSNEYTTNEYTASSRVYQYDPSGQTYKPENQGWEQGQKGGYWDPVRDV